ncbi:MAG TPA: o-succinylbenzoate synthase [Anaerolineae bacterium]|nr:o-succinylbenzoate synthase [Anaerolineae bacterium]
MSNLQPPTSDLHIERIELRLVRMQLKAPFRTSFGTEHERECIIVSVHGGGLTGWGECVASRGFAADPFRATTGTGGASRLDWHLYSYETTVTAWHILRDFLVPQVLGRPLSIDDMVDAGQQLRGHPLARAGLEAALWDLTAQLEGIPLSRALGGTRERVSVGVSVGIQPSYEALVDTVDAYLAQGYRRIKIKIKPGYDLEAVKRIRAKHPDILLQVDANSAYTLADAPLFEAMDEHKLLLIEQPLGWDDLYEHSKLQPRLRTPICLDESIHSLGHARLAIELGAARVINIKAGRVSGFTESRRIHDLCQSRGVPVWCGGMLETGIGRAGNVALASLPNFTLPGDVSASDRYFHEDIVDPPFTLNSDSTISVPISPGLGVAVNLTRLDAVTVRREAFV